MKRSACYRIGLGLAVLLLLGGCSSSGPYMKTDEGPGHSLVYGYIDMKEALAKLGWVSMKRVRPRVEKPFYSFWIRDGAFYSNNIPHRSYHFTKFGGFNGWTQY